MKSEKSEKATEQNESRSSSVEKICSSHAILPVTENFSEKIKEEVLEEVFEDGQYSDFKWKKAIDLAIQKTAKAIFKEIENKIQERIQYCRLHRKADRKVAPSDLEYWDEQIIGLQKALEILEKLKSETKSG